MKELIIDIETLDTIETSAITSLSCIVYDPTQELNFNDLIKAGKTFKLDWMDQLNSGRTYSESTVEFWKNPDNKVAYESCVKLKPSDLSIQEFISEFITFLENSGYDLSDNSNSHVYSRGNAFDFGILEHLYRTNKTSYPFRFWNYRDVRTAIDVIAKVLVPNHKNRGYLDDFPEIDGFVKHDSIHDCARDLLLMQQTRNLLT